MKTPRSAHRILMRATMALSGVMLTFSTINAQSIVAGVSSVGDIYHDLVPDPSFPLQAFGYPGPSGSVELDLDQNGTPDVEFRTSGSGGSGGGCNNKRRKATAATAEANTTSTERTRSGKARVCTAPTIEWHRASPKLETPRCRSHACEPLSAAAWLVWRFFVHTHTHRGQPPPAHHLTQGKHQLEPSLCVIAGTWCMYFWRARCLRASLCLIVFRSSCLRLPLFWLCLIVSACARCVVSFRALFGVFHVVLFSHLSPLL